MVRIAPIYIRFVFKVKGLAENSAKSLVFPQAQYIDMTLSLQTEFSIFSKHNELRDLNPRAQQVRNPNGACVQGEILDESRFELQITQRASAIDQRLNLNEAAITALLKDALVPD